jgi:hypothetical protein
MGLAGPAARTATWEEVGKLPLSYDPRPAPYPSLYEFYQMLSVPSVHRAGAPGPLLRTQIERHSATQQIAGWSDLSYGSSYRPVFFLSLWFKFMDNWRCCWGAAVVLLNVCE